MSNKTDRRKIDREYQLARLSNFSDSFEGQTAPPKTESNQRVPLVQGPIVAKRSLKDAGTMYYLTFLEPVNTRISKYNVYYTTNDQAGFLSGPITAAVSPIPIFIAAPTGTRITFFIQTELPSGLKSEIDQSPTATATAL